MEGTVGGSKSEMESGSTSNNNERHVVFEDGSWFGQFKNGPTSWMARYGLDLLSLQFAGLGGLKNCEGDRGCLDAEDILQTSMLLTCDPVARFNRLNSGVLLLFNKLSIGFDEVALFPASNASWTKKLQ
ncbi:hypothetical protein GOBAR_DD10731 [Gossypium barbadense]|nr:hypothetical protein GOBAR_DD10731 [Gossypium barbadense]